MTAFSGEVHVPFGKTSPKEYEARVRLAGFLFAFRFCGFW